MVLINNYRKNLSIHRAKGKLKSACEHGNLKKLKKVLSASNLKVNCKISTTDERVHTPLVIATKFGHSKLVSSILTMEVSAEDIKLALPHATENLHPEILQSFFNFGAYPSDDPELDRCLLTTSILEQNIEILKILLNRPDKIPFLNSKITCPIILDLNLENFLTSFNSIQEISVKYGIERIHIQSSSTKIILGNGYEESLDQLADALRLGGFTLNEVSLKKIPPLYLAIISDSEVEILKFLMDNGSLVQGRTEFGETPLHAAVKMEKLKFVMFLLNFSDTNVNCRDYKGNTPLHFSRQCQITWILLQNGGDINITNNKSKMPEIRFCNAGRQCAVLVHFKKLELLGYKIDKVSFGGISLDEEETKDCLEELEVLKKIFVSKAQEISLYDILVFDNNNFPVCSGNGYLEKLIKRYGNNFSTMFWNYGFLMNLLAGVRNHTQQDQWTKRLCSKQLSNNP